MTLMIDDEVIQDVNSMLVRLGLYHCDRLNLDFCLDMQKKKDRCYWMLKIKFETERRVSVPVQILSYLFYKNKQTVITRSFLKTFWLQSPYVYRWNLFEITSVTPLSHSHLDECDKDIHLHILSYCRIPWYLCLQLSYENLIWGLTETLPLFRSHTMW
jgi:hypothetical protein